MAMLDTLQGSLTYCRHICNSPDIACRQEGRVAFLQVLGCSSPLTLRQCPSVHERLFMVEHAGSISPLTHPRGLRSAHLLLVDDDPALLEALSGTLQLRLGHFTVETCDTAMKALACVTAKQYDTIISDVNMPGMSGLEFLTLVRQVRPLTPVVLISGHADHALVSKLIDAGAADFIAKPSANKQETTACGTIT